MEPYREEERTNASEALASAADEWPLPSDIEEGDAMQSGTAVPFSIAKTAIADRTWPHSRLRCSAESRIRQPSFPEASSRRSGGPAFPSG